MCSVYVQDAAMSGQAGNGSAEKGLVAQTTTAKG